MGMPKKDVQSLLSGKKTPKLPPDAIQALLKEMQIDATIRMVDYFHGASLYYEPSSVQKFITRMSGKAAEKLSGAPSLQDAKSASDHLQAIMKVIMDRVSKAMEKHTQGAGIAADIVMPVASAAFDLVKEQLGPSKSLEKVPVLSVLPDAYKAVTKNYAAVDGIVKAVHAWRYSEVVVAGSPRAAAEAVSKILKRKAAYLSSQAGTSLANLGLSIATVATTGIAAGVEVGIKVATTIADLVAELIMLAIELWELAAGKRLLQTINQWPHELLIEDDIVGDIFPTAFNAAPILGSYMLASAPYFNTSDFVCLTAGKGMLASVDDIERIAVKNVNPLRLYASQIITESKVKLSHPDPDVNAVMNQAGLRAEAAAAKTIKGRAKAKINKHIVDPMKNKVKKLFA